MESKTKPSSRMIGPDIIRVLAMLMVVYIHTAYTFTLRPDFFSTKLWFVLEPFLAISKTTILLFFMVSGYLVINKNRTIKDNWEKTKKRILIPLLFFSAINIIYALTKFQFSEGNEIIFFKEQLIRITNFPSSPLWFLVVLFFLYLLNPVWRLIFSDEKNRKIAIYITALAIAYSIITSVIKFPSMKADFFFNNFTAWLGFLGFYLYGGLTRNNWIDFKNMKLNLVFIFIGFITLFFGDYYTSYAEIHNINFIWSGYFYLFTSLPVILMALGIFNLLIHADYSKLHNTNRGKNFVKLIQWLAGLSFGIYLIHTYIVSVFTDVLNFEFDKISMNVYLYNILNYSLVLSISIIITLLIKKMPKLKAIIGE